jgi:hypothetical protein
MADKCWVQGKKARRRKEASTQTVGVIFVKVQMFKPSFGGRRWLACKA